VADGNPYCPLVVNGSMNSQTVKALQWKLDQAGYGLTIDGIFGPLTDAALEEHIALSGDSDLYPSGSYNPDALVLQRWIVNVGQFNVAEDGYWGLHTTEGLQLSLNAGRF
jgi:peptidoglycan hydrolase-like protein with peptidoglycan-binding domain